MVCPCWAPAAPPAIASVRSNSKPARQFLLAKSLAIRKKREVQICLVFTGLEPYGEQKYWCGP
jgi:hypothetical protein